MSLPAALYSVVKPSTTLLRARRSASLKLLIPRSPWNILSEKGSSTGDAINSSAAATQPPPPPAELQLKLKKKEANFIRNHLCCGS
jgi:hypothetical protein